MYKRTYGWVQNPSDFTKLKTVVQIFDPSSGHYAKLGDELIDSLIPFPELKANLLGKTLKNLGEFSYSELVGTSKGIDGKAAKDRKDAVADGLIQISILPQSFKTKGKRWTDNWTSDGYLRWALSLNLVEHDRRSDCCRITEKGRAFSQSTLPIERDPILLNALLGYPPASRILELLSSQKNGVDKFYLGEHLGFKGERGFTSYPSELMNEWLKTADTQEQKQIRTDREGTADKYARMICSWLTKVGYVKKTATRIKTITGDSTGFPLYSITAKGSHAFMQSLGSSKNKKISKYINWEFLAVDGGSPSETSNRDYIRSRRAYILSFLMKSQSRRNLLLFLKSKGFDDSPQIIENDILGLNSIGIRIESKNNKLILKDNIHGLDIPNLAITPALKSSEVEALKAQLMESTNLPLKFYQLVDLAYNDRSGRDFEMLTFELFKEIYGFNGTWLGGGRRPDAVIYSEQGEPFGVIIDTKAYSKGYRKSLQQEDEMVRYVHDNLQRDKKTNSTEWWNEFGEAISPYDVSYLWVSSAFVGEFDAQLESTSRRTGAPGAAIGVDQLILGADKVLKKDISLSDFKDLIRGKNVISL